jgi:CheY-like chemotaxis protein
MSGPGDAPALEPALAVLLVDDSPTNLRITGAALARLGCEVVTAESGEAALERLHAQPFALILLDYQMPGLDGPATARAILGRLGEQTPPMLALTGHVDLEVFRACREAGMRLVLKKPLEAAQLRTIVERLAEIDGGAREAPPPPEGAPPRPGG